MQAPLINKTQKYLIGNWKANKTLKEARTWIGQIKNSQMNINEKLSVALCPSFIHLHLFKQELPQLTLGCQDISPFGDGAYTGEVTARMLRELVSYVILGHSERRRYFGENEQTVVLKAIQALDNQLTPIIALDAGNWRKQMNALEEEIIKNSIIMYEPPEAISEQIGPIGKGKVAPLDEVKKMIAKIKEESPAKRVIYGGSVKSNNIGLFLSESLIDGVLPGSASLNPQEWMKMIDIAGQTLDATGKI